MATAAVIQRLQTRASQAEQIISQLRAQLDLIRKSAGKPNKMYTSLVKCKILEFKLQIIFIVCFRKIYGNLIAIRLVYFYNIIVV